MIRNFTLALSLTGTMLLSTVSIGFAQSPTGQKAEAPSYNSIRHADYFAVGGTGYAGDLSYPEQALLVTLKHRDTKSLLALTKSENTVSRLYGLLALRYLNHPEYKNVAKQLLASKASVTTLQGCTFDKTKVSIIAAQIVKGEFNSTLTADAKRLEKQKLAATK